MDSYHNGLAAQGFDLSFDDTPNPELVQVMAWCQTGDEPLLEPMLNNLKARDFEVSWLLCDTIAMSGTHAVESWNHGIMRTL